MKIVTLTVEVVYLDPDIITYKVYEMKNGIIV